MNCDPNHPRVTTALKRTYAYVRWMPFGFILGLILYAYLTLIVSLAISYTLLGKGQVIKGCLQFIISSILAGGASWSFIVAVFKNPGVPRWDGQAYRREEQAGYELHGEDDTATAPLLYDPLPGQPQLPSRTGREQLSEIWVKSTGESRWCNKCNAPKPDRSHHCSTCGRCILRMDHHCPWLASRCIGLRNHKAFFLFLLYTALFCIYVLQETGRALLAYVESEQDGFETSPIAWAVVLFIAFIFGASLTPFAAYHAWLICRNRTTIESMEGSGRVRLRARRDPSVSDRLLSVARASLDHSTPPWQEQGEWRTDQHLTREERRTLRKAGKLNIYDVGVAENWRQIMGSKAWLWFIPIGEPQGDGNSFLVNVQTLKQLKALTESIRATDAQPSLGDSEITEPSSLQEDWRAKGSKFQGTHGEMEWGDTPKKSAWGLPFHVD